jgi:hypothetical protein
MPSPQEPQSTGQVQGFSQGAQIWSPQNPQSIGQVPGFSRGWQTRSPQVPHVEEVSLAENPQRPLGPLPRWVLVERWRRHYNTIPSHSSLGYNPPAPEARMPLPPGFAPLSLLAAMERLT